ncbi:MAG: hypothetical protein ABIZ70_05285 [Gemmatimonadales bacterium]
MTSLDGSPAPDGGELVRPSGVKVTPLGQDGPSDVVGAIFDIGAEGPAGPPTHGRSLVA